MIQCTDTLTDYQFTNNSTIPIILNRERTSTQGQRAVPCTRHSPQTSNDQKFKKIYKYIHVALLHKPHTRSADAGEQHTGQAVGNEAIVRDACINAFEQRAVVHAEPALLKN